MHAVRHQFKPSPQLARSISGFMKSPGQSDILLLSTKTVIVDSAAYMYESYKDQRRLAEAAVLEARNTKFQIGELATQLIFPKRPVGEYEYEYYDRPHKYRLGFGVEDKYGFNELAKTLDVYPTVQSVTEPRNHYLYLDIPITNALDSLDRDEAETAFRERIQSSLGKGLFYASINGIGAMQMSVPHGINR